VGLLDDFSERRFNPDDLSKEVVDHDKWDTNNLHAIQGEMKEFANSQRRLGKEYDTGWSAFTDTFFALVKANPEILDRKDVRPSHYVNRKIMDEAMKLTEYDELRMWSMNDIVAAAMSSVSMEDDIRTLFDRLEKEREQAKQLEQMMCSLQQMQDEDNEDSDEDSESPPEPGDGDQDFQSQMQDRLDALREQIAAAEAELDESLEDASTQISLDLKTAMKGAIEQAETMEGVAAMWGADPGQLRKMNPAERIKLAQRIDNDRIRKLADLFGAMLRMAFAERAKRTIHSRDEIHDVEMGNDLSRVLPVELLNLDDPILELDFYRRFYENSLLQYQLRGTEKLARGGIIQIEDTSGSMSGDRQLWAKAVGLVLLHIARSQKRPMYIILFGSAREIKVWDFRDTQNISPDQVLDYASEAFGGGTEFMGPLTHAREVIKWESEAEARVKSDLVMLTDGMAPVLPEWLEQWIEDQKTMDFKCYGVAIGCSSNSQPLFDICQGRTVEVKKLTDGNDMRPVFGAL
jgi:uncharacterized protein with von Willebrand factor type A (vWA) domain